MPETFELEIATPEKLVLREQVEEAQIPAANGYIGVLPEHSPLLSELGIGELSYLAGGRRYYIAINGGWVEVLPRQVRVLATTAETADEIDVNRATEALHRAEVRLASPAENIDMARALNAFRRAQARAEVVKHGR